MPTTRQVCERLIEAAAQVVCDRAGEFFVNDPSLAELESTVRFARKHLEVPPTAEDRYEATLEAYEQDVMSARSRALSDMRRALGNLAAKLPDGTDPAVAQGISMAIDALNLVSIRG